MAGKAFWDSSALVTLLVRQTSSDRSHELAKSFPEFIVWWGASVEIRSALARLQRMGELTDTDKNMALERLARLRLSWRYILPSRRILRIAETLPDRHKLRTGDAFQLAAALVWCGENPHDHPFVGFDDDLNAAATSEGFDVHRRSVV